MKTLYPLRFEPLFRRYLWGGRRLSTVLHKPLGEGNDYAESWEVVDHGDDQSCVRAGPLSGTTLNRLVIDHGPELFGSNGAADRFPLLFKFLDANRDLSVQVHPDDRQAARLSPPDLGKTEAWVILDTLPGSKVYAGLKSEVDHQELASEVARGNTQACLHVVEPQIGDCIFVPAGTVHALGAGLLVAEIQQSSDTTFRLFDWNRTGADGKPRMLHVTQSLETIDYSRGPVDPQTPQATDRTDVRRLVHCDKFVLDRWQFDSPASLTNGPHRFHLLAVLGGSLMIDGDPTGEPLSAGQTALIPASIAERTILRPAQATTLLDIYLP